MTMRLHLKGFKETADEFQNLPRRLRLKHMRIAMNAGGGIIKKDIAHRVRKVTRSLEKSIRVKVKIPAASFNIAHHSKPAYAVIGAQRKYERPIRRTAKGKIVGTRNKAAAIGVRRPSRYLHLLEKGTRRSRAFPAVGPAVTHAGPRAHQVTLTKLRSGLESEAARIYQRTKSAAAF